jgi:hypothetical protein
MIVFVFILALMKYKLLLLMLLLFAQQTWGQTLSAKVFMELSNCANDSCLNMLVKTQGFVLDPIDSDTYIPLGADSIEAENNFISIVGSGIYYNIDSKHGYNKLIAGLKKNGFKIERFVKATRCVGSDLYDYASQDPHYNLRIWIMKDGVDYRPKYRFWLIHYTDEYYKNVILAE